MATADHSNEDVTPLAVQGLIEEVCEKYETAWQHFQRSPASESRPTIAPFVEGFPQIHRAALTSELLHIEIAWRRKSGEQPQPGDYEGQFVEHHKLIEKLCREPAASSVSQRLPTESTVNASSGQTLAVEGQIGRYRLIEKLGRGGQADTFLVFDPDLEREAVIKKYRSVVGPKERQAVLNEGRALAKVDSPYVARCLNVEYVDGHVLLVMEYVPGKNLAERLCESSIGLDAAVDVVAQLAQGLTEVHAAGVLHRDIKPANVVLAADGTPRLVDFGLAIPVDATVSSELGGTLQYMSPEQALCDTSQIDCRSDVFGLGAVLYRLIAGKALYQGNSDRELLQSAREARFASPRTHNADVPERLEAVCLKCIAPNPVDRYPSAEAVARALRAYRRSSSEVLARAPNRLAINPYRGLQPFTEGDSNFFFGRDQQIERLWNALCDLHSRDADTDQPRLIPLVGPSGCGKSSLARAGLIAELRRRPLPGQNDTQVLTFTPGQRPLSSLATALAAAADGGAHSAVEFERLLKLPNDAQEYDGLLRAVDSRPGHLSADTMLIVDQFEETYSLCADAEERHTFIETLLCATTNPTSRCSIVLTIRGDFLAATQDHQTLNALIAERGLIVPALTESELRQAISEPARLAGRPLDASTVDLLVAETKNREGALPLLQFALSRIWDGLRDGQEPSDTLRQIGGVGGALAGEAQIVFDSLTEDEQAIARRAFLSMVQLGDGMSDMRRRAEVSEITSAHQSTTTVHDVLSKFATARLITLAQDSGSDTVEVAHEALLEQWPAFRAWLDESRDDLRFHRRLDEAARHWHEQQCPDGLLWQTPDLDYLRQFQQRASGQLTREQTDFYHASDTRDLEQKRKRKQRVRIYQGLTAAIGVLAIATGYFGIQAKQATERAWRSEQNTELQGDLTLDSLLLLARGATDRLARVPHPEASLLRKELIETAIERLEIVISEGNWNSLVSAAARLRLGNYLLELDKPYQALAEFQESLKSVNLMRNAPKYGGDKKWVLKWNLARVEDGIGDARRALGERDLAKQHYENALKIRQEWLKLGQERAQAEQALAVSYSNFGSWHREDMAATEQEAALTYVTKALELRERLYAEDPSDTRRRYDLGGTFVTAGGIRKRLGNHRQAIDNLKKGISHLKAALEAGSMNPAFNTNTKRKSTSPSRIRTSR